MTNTQKKSLELYVHIPFCARKCLYCDFLSFRALAAVHQEYTAQLIREIEVQGALNNEYQVTTVFIGGGTPSVMDPLFIRDIMDALYRSFDIAGDAEITIEVNPGTLLAGKLQVYRACGINRLSIGLQSADNRELKALGRIHSFEEFLKSFQSARMAGFTDINVDLMSSIPGQTLDSWKNTLKKVTMLKPEHISAYSLIIEEGTPFWDRYGAAGQEASVSLAAVQGGQPEAPGSPEAVSVSQPVTPGSPEAVSVSRLSASNWTGSALRGRTAYPPLPDEDTENRIYHLTRNFLKSQGYERYEISNYAKPGHECRHNIGYWTEASYLGLGLGAASYVGGCRFSNERDLDAYLSLDFSGESGLPALKALHGQVQELSREEQMEEFMFLGLRMIRGISEIDFVAMFGVKLETVYGPVISRLKADGLMKQEGVWLSLTEWGMDVSNFVLSEFLLS